MDTSTNIDKERQRLLAELTTERYRPLLPPPTRTQPLVRARHAPAARHRSPRRATGTGWPQP